ncbi:Transcriptional repressor MprA [compost metagenome]|uniref:MarR family transcriptional regulator n=1 Tax=Cupriavidus campinensis TaxID=151783 RepID=A0AAE9I4J5_9BURK|nr:MarR family transcriptional regulator [Cupriavidus campinensis]TSP11139.1 MarR family transcriptional regulator [Cupriavidus campinensis]URF07194.1 MarR family transcriptional regulator [Cupriavidus campinensis]
MPFEQRIARFCAEYPDAPHDLMLASRLLLRSARLLRHHIERALAPHALDMGQYLVMSLLLADGGQPTMPSELGVAIDATRTQMTRLIDGLEARGLVQRKTSTQDRRSLELTLTAEGRALLDRAAPAVHAAYGEAWAPLGKDRLADVTRDLAQLHQNLAALDAQRS